MNLTYVTMQVKVSEAAIWAREGREESVIPVEEKEQSVPDELF